MLFLIVFNWSGFWPSNKDLWYSKAPNGLTEHQLFAKQIDRKQEWLNQLPIEAKKGKIV
jgi:hypothetical protein